MEMYISHISAALLLEVPFLHVVLGYPTIEDVREALFVEQVTFGCDKARKRQATVQSHIATLALPKGAIIDVAGQQTASPELVFLQLAPKLGFHRTVLLGLQLCASEIGGASITNTSKIRRFLTKTSGHAGHKAALQAAKYIVDGSASIMESLLYMLLTLPNMYGGFALKGAKLNHEISLEGKNTSLANRRIFADLFWEKAKLVVEYDSYTHHNNTSSWIKDTQRLAAIERLGYKTVSINTAQLYNAKAFEEVAQVIAGLLNKRLRVRTERFLLAQSALRELLPLASRASD